MTPPLPKLAGPEQVNESRPHRNALALLTAYHQVAGRNPTTFAITLIIDRLHGTDLGMEPGSSSRRDIDHALTDLAFAGLVTDLGSILQVTELGWDSIDPTWVDRARRALTKRHSWTILDGVIPDGELVE